MSLRALLALLVLIIGCAWTLRRPLVGVCMNILFFHLNLGVLGAGLETIRFQFYGTLALMISYFLNHDELTKVPTPAQPPMRLLFVFTSICYLTSAWAAASTSLAFDSAVDFSKIVLFSWLIMKIVRTEKDLHIVIWVTLIGIAYTSFMGYWGEMWGWINEKEVGVSTGGTGTHIMMYFPMMMVMILFGKIWEKLVAAVILMIVLIFMPALPEGLRSTFVALVASATFFVIFAPGRIRAKSIIPLIIAGLLFVSYFVPPEYWDEMLTILNPSTESSAASREVINQASWQILRKYPLGIGYNNYSLVSLPYIPEEYLSDMGTRDAHNSYLKVACEFGVVGFVVWILTFFVTWIYFRKVRKTMTKDRPPTNLQLYALAFEVGLIGITLSIYTHNYNDLDTLYWFVALSCVLYNIHQNNHKEEQPERTEVKAPHEIVLERIRAKKQAQDFVPQVSAK
ncbi:MAG: O-antigen ligase family protein [candidate division KSB1 bacterium]|nr:O-antigen ligase family protein [candidate division KSB1 bacterium]MDZ7302274.1 O-antigen ligase family protein [candidate division KSB1 bacterium]MDZ7311380.1 O-antigen ligase family protein [candidate division KSB1 bacterium]